MFRSQIAELWFPYDRTIAIDRRRSQTITEDRTWFYLLRSSAITIAGSQTIAEVCFHMIADDRRTFCDLRSAIVCDNMETSLKVSVKENELPTEKILVARVFSLRRQVIYQIKAKRSNYLIKDFISSIFKRRLSFLLSNSEVSSLLLKLQPFRVAKYSLPFYCI